ncbi:hypothetical protein E2C01_077714 [Portunus trituberculatus]|uniref:Uncharacterized protein n=1 Tax=Portunus trituberculatus TaxID=210409 RepID=A0A5B7IL06_PORTR|nr:hypothetical protein [Portunus trituberculatus]
MNKVSTLITEEALLRALVIITVAFRNSGGEGAKGFCRRLCPVVAGRIEKGGRQTERGVASEVRRRAVCLLSGVEAAVRFGCERAVPPSPRPGSE